MESISGTEVQRKKPLYMPEAPRGLITFFTAMWFIIGLIFCALGFGKIIGYNVLKSQCTQAVTVIPQNAEEGFSHGWSNGGSTREDYFAVDYVYEYGGKDYSVSRKYPKSAFGGETADVYMQSVGAMIDLDKPSRIFFGDEFSGMSAVIAVTGLGFIGGGVYMRKVNERPA